MHVKQKVDFKQAKKAIEQGNIVYTDKKHDRGVGKTMALVAHSIWTGKPIIIDRSLMANVYSGYLKDVDVIHIEYVRDNEICKNGVLVDDGLSQESLAKLIGIFGEDKVSGFMTDL